MAKRPGKSPAPKRLRSVLRKTPAAGYRSMSVYSLMSFSAGELRKATYRDGRPIRPALSS